MALDLRPVRVETATDDEEGLLVFSGDRLVAILVQLSSQHGDQAGLWFLEHGFGRLDGNNHPVFADIDAAQHWMTRRLRDGHERSRA